MTAPAPVRVARWRDLPGLRRKRPPAGLLCVLVDGQAAGEIAYSNGTWHAAHWPRVAAPARQSEHPAADEALRAVLRSGFARYLGARAASRVSWSDAARRVASRDGAR